MTPPERPRVLVCGGRDYDDTERVYEVLDRVNPLTICHGGQATWVPERRGYIGADYLAGRWAEDREVYCQVYPADWKAFGPRAGPMRNKVMLDAFEPDLLYRFPRRSRHRVDDDAGSTPARADHADHQLEIVNAQAPSPTARIAISTRVGTIHGGIRHGSSGSFSGITGHPSAPCGRDARSPGGSSR